MQTIRKIRHPSRDFTVPIVVAKFPIVVAILGSDGGDCFHGSKKHSSLPPARRRRLKGCNSSLYHCFFLPYDGNALWFIRIRHLCSRYNLLDPLQVLAAPPHQDLDVPAPPGSLQGSGPVEVSCLKNHRQ